MEARDLGLIFGIISIVCTVIGYGGEFILYLIG